MTFATWINQLRAQVGDTKRRVHVDWIADGNTNVFQMPDDTFPILDDSTTYTVKLATVIKTETTDYTLDKEGGTITFVSTPGAAAAVTMDSVAVNLLDADWLQITNDVTKSLGDDFFKEFVDTSLTSTAAMLSLSLAVAAPKCIAVYELQTRHATTDEWTAVEERCNWRYDRENNIIYFGITTAFGLTGELMRVRGLKSYTLGTAVGDTVDVQDRFLTILEMGCIARYWRWRYKDVIEMVSKNTQDNTRTPLQELIMLADRFDRLYEGEKAKLKPGKPARIIPPFKNGGGRP